MGYTEISYRSVTKTRKKHICGWCGTKIEVGEKAHYRSYIFDDAFQTDYMHDECRTAMLESDAGELQEGWYPGDFYRGKTIEESETIQEQEAEND